MEKTFKITKVNSANITVDNSADEGREYSISATLDINSAGNVGSIYGEVRKGDNTSTSTSYGENNLSINFNTVSSDEMAAMLIAVNEFVKSVRSTDWTKQELFNL